MLQIERDSGRLSYTDTAVTAPTRDDLDKLALFTETRGGREVVVKFK